MLSSNETYRDRIHIMSKALGVVLAFVGLYTDYALANAFITSSNLWTLALGLYKTSQTVGVGFNYGIFSAFSFLMGLPILIIYLVFQRGYDFC
jgi:arabinogalactan oligomer/maltooligosaccharide transport system permease protein